MERVTGEPSATPPFSQSIVLSAIAWVDVSSLLDLDAQYDAGFVIGA
jgi:hypothetical protein